MRNSPEMVISRNLKDMIRALGLVTVKVHDSNVDSRIVTNWTFR
jgi:hypothetical protein